MSVTSEPYTPSWRTPANLLSKYIAGYVGIELRGMEVWKWHVLEEENTSGNMLEVQWIMRFSQE